MQHFTCLQNFPRGGMKRAVVYVYTVCVHVRGNCLSAAQHSNRHLIPVAYHMKTYSPSMRNISHADSPNQQEGKKEKAAASLGE